LSFILGEHLTFKNKTIEWDPDSCQTQNPHLLICGASGSGKTTLLRNILNYLKQSGKNVHVIDFHGDLSISGERCFEFTARNQDASFGINPFEFERDEKNGGPNVNSDIIVSIFQKCFIPNMGALQKALLTQLIRDTYRVVGILDEDPSTWNIKPPSVEIFYQFFLEIKDSLTNPFYKPFRTLFYDLQKAMIESKSVEFPTLYSAGDKALEEERRWAPFDSLSMEEHKKLEKSLLAIKEKFLRLCDFCWTGENGAEFDILQRGFKIDDYDSPQKIKALESLDSYIKSLAESSLFSFNAPNPTRGVNRYNIAGFTNAAKPHLALFFADIMIQKIFRANKARGEYRLLPNAMGKVDTFIVIDESKLVMPTGKEKENPFNIFNRIVTEIRKFGVGLIIVSQRIDHFNDEILGAVYTKIFLRVDPNDMATTMKKAGIKKEDILKSISNFGVAVITQGQTQTQVKLKQFTN